MNKSILVCSVVVLALGICLSIKWFSSGRLYEKTQCDYQNKISMIKETLAAVGDVPQLEARTSEINYELMYEQARALAHFRDIKYSLEFPGLNEAGQINGAWGQSRFPGVERAEMKLTFSDIKDLGDYIKVLRCLTQWEKQFPIEIKTIDNLNRNIQVAVDLYKPESKYI
jgi:hypothetical protein